MTVTVLIVDDHPAFRRVAGAMLRDAGYDVVGEVGDAAGALEAALRMRPDVVLLDVCLPDMDGISVAAALPPEPRGPRVVLTSSREPIDFQERLLDSPATGFIPKRALSVEGFAALAGGP